MIGSRGAPLSLVRNAAASPSGTSNLGGIAVMAMKHWTESNQLLDVSKIGLLVYPVESALESVSCTNDVVW